MEAVEELDEQSITRVTHLRGEKLPAMVTDLFPVSALWDPPFNIMVLGMNAECEENDNAHKKLVPGAPIPGASSSITNWGTWHPGVHPTRRPGLTEALVGDLGGHRRYLFAYNFPFGSHSGGIYLVLIFLVFRRYLFAFCFRCVCSHRKRHQLPTRYNPCIVL
jgi:hypothetical protein